MTGKFLKRAARRRCQAMMIWAMAPVILINGHVVSGCLSPTGHFEPGCNCAAMHIGESGASQTAGATTCHCHCPCCQGKSCCCCCNGKSCCQAMASKTHQPKADGLQNPEHCRPYSTYAVTPVVKGSAHTSVDRVSMLAIIPLSPLAAVVTKTAVAPAELNTGPPPDNLVVALHRFLI
jgi:hypothetical protein